MIHMGGIESKLDLMSLLRGLKLEPLDEPLAVVVLGKFQQRLGQLPGGFKAPDPKKLFFEGPRKTFDTAGTFWAFTGKRRRRCCAPRFLGRFSE
jgi:hypothetical protein